MRPSAADGATAVALLALPVLLLVALTVAGFRYRNRVSTAYVVMALGAAAFLYVVVRELRQGNGGRAALWALFGVVAVACLAVAASQKRRPPQDE